MIRQKLDRRIKTFDDRIMFTNYWVPIARYEDDWDAILAAECGFAEEGDNSGRREDQWLHEVKLAERENMNKYENDMAKDREITKRMVELIDKETELARQEGQEVVRGRKNKPIRDRWLK